MCGSDHVIDSGSLGRPWLVATRGYENGDAIWVISSFVPENMMVRNRLEPQN